MEVSTTVSDLNGTGLLYNLVFVKEIEEMQASKVFEDAYQKSIELELDPKLISDENVNASDI